MFDNVDADAIIGLAIVAMLIAGFAAGIVVMIARQIAWQRVAENLMRERLARHWASVRTEAPPGPPVS